MPPPNPWAKITAYADKPERLLVGLMSGTSVDGADAVLVRISGSGRTTQAEQVAFVTHPFPAYLRDEVLRVSHGGGNAAAVAHLSFVLGSYFADAAQAVLDTVGVSPDALDAAASHGQTVAHLPQYQPSATLQIGEPSVIAQRLGVPVVSDFRTADMALGGQGAPLVPYADWCLLTHPTKTRCIQNIGGIGNVTYLPANAAPEQVIGFDTGPGNMLIDRAAQHVSQGRLSFDENGALARAETVSKALLSWLLTHPFLLQTPPKSAGRENFGEVFWHAAQEKANALGVTNQLVATITAYTARTIADAYARFLPALPDEIIIGGGGTRNPVLMQVLTGLLSPIPVRTHEELGMNSDSKEAIAFAVLANETLLGKPSNLPFVTGASRPAVLGKVTLP